MFVYFSHEFVSIPPVSWITTGHLHGVKVIGTIIAEWHKGAVRTLELIEGDFIDVLVDICEYFGFDGWLLNFECHLPSAAQATKLCDWVCACIALCGCLVRVLIG